MYLEHTARDEEQSIDWSYANLNDAARSDPWVQKRMREPLVPGVVHCVYRPKTSYPARIYVFMNADLWLLRNRKVSGCQGRPPFITRRMNREECIYHHFDKRLHAYQYENWNRFFEAECREAEILERESPGSSLCYINGLQGFEQTYSPLLKGFCKPASNLRDLQLSLF